jgi:hypothetical protein
MLRKKLTSRAFAVGGLEVLTESRGPQLQRTLNLPFDIKQKFLLRDPEKVIRAMAHTMFPDMELYRATGSVNGGKIFQDLEDEYVQKEAAAMMLPPEKRAAAMKNLLDEFNEAENDWHTLIDRLRHQRAIPLDADSFGYRLGRSVMALNVARMMGGVVPSSFSDMARVTFRYGLNGSFKQAWKPMLADLPRVKATRQEAYRAGIALDPLLHNRAAAIADVGDNYASRQSFIERGIEFLANKTGAVALFDRWTAEMKLIATNAVFGEMSHNLRMLFNGSNNDPTALAFFKEVGIDQLMAARIWDQYIIPGGSTEFSDGFRLPNSDRWTDDEAVMAMQAAVSKVVNDLIVTPGLDRPSWMDQNLAFKMVGQFKSFTFSSTNRILMSGLQEPDMVFLQGAISSIALGALSYYTWAIASGGRAQTEMQNATEQKWIYEALGRSGLLGILGEVQNVGEQIPGLAQSSLFGGETRRTQRSSSLTGALLGPSYDTAERVFAILQGIDDPTQATLQQARALMPYQNVFYIRRLLDQMEKSLAAQLELPERRTN